VRDLADRRGLTSVVVTFDRHPAEVVRPDSAPKLLTDLDQKLELLATTGVDVTLVVHFDEERAHEPAEDFVTEILVEALNTKMLTVGADFHFGHQRRGNVAMLEAMGTTAGFDVAPIELVSLPGVDAPVSSTRIRQALGDGDVSLAATLLGRFHEVRGVVQHGDKRGRELGFPTANVAVPDRVMLPADGIYAGWYRTGDGEARAAALSLGRRPTFYDDHGQRLLEAYLLDFDGDLYNTPARVCFVERLRGEVKFDSVDALVAQIGADVVRTREVLSPPTASTPATA
jgi:riboflavin kinase/FMN adenylyltransferase